MFSIRNGRRPAPSAGRRARPWLEVLEDRITPAHLFVNTLSQTIDPTDNLLSLREAIEAVNSGDLSQLSTAEKGQVSTAQDPLGTNDTIEFQVTGTIGLTQELTLSRDVTIRGPATSLTVSGQNMCRVFNVVASAHASVSISNLTIANGNAVEGGGIYNNSENLTLTNCVLSNNLADDSGGAIANYWGLTLNDCTLSGNSAMNVGGGIRNEVYMRLDSCIISNNSASSDGGGIFANGYSAMVLTNTTMSGNSAVNGGGVYSYVANATLNNCTISNNSASSDGGGIQCFGGGVNNTGVLTLANCTLSDNSANSGGGINNHGNLTLNNSIVADSLKGGDIVNWGLLSGSNNLVEDGSGLPGWLSGDPRLGPLQDNGGPTQTMALLPGSAAIDAGDNSLVPAMVSTDQRGGNRFVNGVADLGAFEYWPTELTGAVVSPGPDISATEGASTGPVVAATFTDANPAAHLADFTASIAWGDGNTSPGTISYDAGTGTYTVTDSHTYAEEGTYALNVSITAADSSTVSTSVAATVADAALTAGALTPPRATEGNSTGEVVLFHFSDANPNTTAADFTATATWGDGRSNTSADGSGTVRVVANASGGFDVVGSHTYADEASGLSFAVTVQDVGGALPISASATINVADAALTAGALTPPAATEGISTGDVVLLHFSDANPNATAADYVAVVHWGDGRSNTSADGSGTVRVVANAAGGFGVIGRHTYSEELAGATFSVSVSDVGGAPPISASATINVADAALTAGALTPPVNPALGTPISQQVLFHFTDANPNATAADFTATVTWGDGSVETNFANPADVQVVANGDGFDVIGSHTYTAGVAGLTFQVWVADHGAAPVGGAATIEISTDVVVHGTDGGDSLVLDRTPGGDAGSITYVLNGGAPVALTNATSFTFIGGAGATTMTVSFANGEPLLPGAIRFDGGDGANTLVVDAAGRAARTAPGDITVLGAPKQDISYVNVQATQLRNMAAVNASSGPNTADRDAALAGLTANARFVQALYLADLGRAGDVNNTDDAGGWVAALNSGAMSQADVVRDIASSIEAQGRLVNTWYLTYLGRSAQGGEEQYWVNQLAQGKTHEQVLSGILSSDEFVNRTQSLVASGTAEERYVQGLYRQLLNRSDTAAEVAYWVNRLPQLGRLGVAQGFLVATEFRADQFEGYYNALLHRPSDASLDYWVFSNLDINAVRYGFEASPEFFTNG